MTEIYHWAGSLNCQPEFFELVDYRSKIFYPDEDVIEGVFNMKKVEEPVNMSSHGEVAFDEFATSHSKDSQTGYAEMSSLRESYKAELVSHGKNSVLVKRDNIYEDMISLYKRRGISNKDIQILFVNEDAVGDGVTRDAFASFFQELYDRFDGENEKIPPIDMDEENLETIGKIITHSLVVSGFYPRKISQTAIKYHLFDRKINEELASGFLRYLPWRESSMIESFCKEGDKENVKHIMDIFSECRIYRVPNKENIRDICAQAGNTCLIKQPFFVFKSLVKGMGSFWNRVDVQCFDSMLCLMKPNAEKIITCMEIEENCSQDGILTTYLHRFLRSVSENDLAMFLRFTTGSSYVTEDDIFKVQYFNPVHSYLAPKAATCFKILMLPRGYSSFSKFRDSFLVYLSDKGSWIMHDADVSND